MTRFGARFGLGLLVAAWAMAGCRARYVGSYDGMEPDAGVAHDGGEDGKPADAGSERDEGSESDAAADVQGDASDAASPADASETGAPDALADVGDALDAAIDASGSDGRDSEPYADAQADAARIDAGTDAACTDVLLPAPNLEYTFDDCDDQMPTLKDSAPGRFDALKKGDLHCGGGHSGAGVYFSGDDATGLNGYLTVPGLAPARFTKALTISAWVSIWKSTYSNILGRWYLDDSFLLLLDDTGFAFSVVHASDAGPSTATARAPRVLYNWVHLVAVFDGSSVKLYEDGVLTESTPVDPPGSMATTSRDFQMGGLDVTGTGVPGSFMKGMLDEVRIYDVALDARQVRALDCP